MSRARRRSPNGAAHRRLIWYLATLVLALVLLAASTAWFAVSSSDRSASDRSLALTRVELRQDGGRLRHASQEKTTASRKLSGLQSELGSTEAQMGTADQQLAAASSAVSAQGLDLATLQQCLSGVSGSYRQLATGNLPGTVAALDGSSAACLTVEGGGADGLVYPFDFPDPFLLADGGTYYAYATDSAAGNIQVIRSTDLVRWSPVGDALPHLPFWATAGQVWAPSVLEVHGTFVMYYSTTFGSSGDQCISSATSASPTGPFVDSSSAPLVCQLGLGGSIDPSAFVDPTAGIFLDWKSQGANGQPSALWAQQLTGTGTKLAGTGPTSLLTATQPWEHGTVEAPDMFWLSGERYLFFSGGQWTTATYATGVADCTGPLGPCTTPSMSPILATQAGIAGPGGASAFTDLSGHPDLAFAAWLPGLVGEPHSRVLYVRPLEVTGGQPVVGTGGP
jgi:Glycosyl hydrolases family 43